MKAIIIWGDAPQNYSAPPWSEHCDVPQRCAFTEPDLGWTFKRSYTYGSPVGKMSRGEKLPFPGQTYIKITCEELMVQISLGLIPSTNLPEIDETCRFFIYYD